MTDRKATDVLLEIEKISNLILGYVKSIDSNIKLLINDQNSTPVDEKEIERIKQAALAAAQGPAKDSQTPLKGETVDFPQAAVSSPSGGSTGRPRTVQEKIYYKGTDKIILLAQVEIFDSSGELIKKLRTNNQGSWTAKLEPGNYRIRVAKNKTKAKPALAVNYEISVPAGDGPLTLESRKL